MVSEKMKVSVTIGINASVAEVWEALINPELVRQYFFGTEVYSEWVTGAPITFTGSWEGKEYEDKGTILEIRPGKRLKFNYWSSMSGTEDIPENYSDIEYVLNEGEEGTILTVFQSGINNEEAKKDSEKNWKLVLGEMKKLLEN